MSQNGDRIVAVDWDSTLFIIDLDSGAILRSAALPGTAEAISWHPSSKAFVLLILNDDGTKRSLAQFDTANLTASPIRTNSELMSVQHFGFSPDGNSFATIVQRGADSEILEVQVLDTKTWKLASVIPVPPQSPITLKWAPSSDRVALCSWEGDLSIIDVVNRSIHSSLKLPRRVWDISWSPDGKLLAGACTDSTAMVWDAATLNQKYMPLQHATQVLRIHFGRDSKTLITADETHSLCAWDIEGRQAERTLKLEAQSDTDESLTNVEWKHDDSQLMAGAVQPTMIWSTADGSNIKTLPAAFAHWSYDGKLIAAKSSNRFSIWDSRSYEVVATNQEVKDCLLIAWSPSANLLAGLDDKTLWIWDIASNMTRRSNEVLAESDRQLFRCIAWSPDSMKIAIGTMDGIVYVMDSTRLEHVATFQPFLQPLHLIEWSPDGSELAVAAETPTVQIIDSTTGATNRTLDGHLFEVWDVDWSPDGKRIASAGADGQVIVWDPLRASPILNIPMNEEVRAVKWSHDSQQLAAVSQTGTVKVWSAKIGYATEFEPLETTRKGP